MLMPKRVKRRKQFRGTMKGKALRGNTISYGEYGIIATEPCWIKSNQIEAARVAMTRYIKRGGKVWIKIFPDKPVTAKPAETRMGSGKGALEYWVAVVKPGRVMFEIAGVPEEVAREALRLAEPTAINNNSFISVPPNYLSSLLQPGTHSHHSSLFFHKLHIRRRIQSFLQPDLLLPVLSSLQYSAEPSDLQEQRRHPVQG